MGDPSIKVGDTVNMQYANKFNYGMTNCIACKQPLSENELALNLTFHSKCSKDIMTDAWDLLFGKAVNPENKVFFPDLKFPVGDLPMKYRRKPVEIEAFQYNDCVVDIPWIDIVINEKGKDYCIITTLEGDMRCSTGDWIIKGVKGEFYSVKEDIFPLLYDKVEE